MGLLLGHVVHVSGAIVDLADLMIGPGVVEDALVRVVFPASMWATSDVSDTVAVVLATGFLRLMGRQQTRRVSVPEEEKGRGFLLEDGRAFSGESFVPTTRVGEGV